MPSLSALKEFSFSFGDIAREKADLGAKGLPYTELELPDTEAPPFNPLREGGLEAELEPQPGPEGEGSFVEPQPGRDSGESSFVDSNGDAGSLDLDDFDFGLEQQDQDQPESIPDDFSAADSGEADPEAPLNLDFSAFLDTIPDDLQPGPEDEGGLETSLNDTPLEPQPSHDSGEGELEAPPLNTPLEDFSVPEGLLSGLSDELESSIPEGGDDFDMGAESADLNLDDEPGHDSGEGELEADLNDASLNTIDLDGESLDLGGETVDLGGEQPDFDMPAAEDAADDGGLDLDGETIDLDGGQPDFDISAVEDFTDEGGLDLGGEAAVSDEDFQHSSQEADELESLDDAELLEEITEDAAEPQASPEGEGDLEAGLETSLHDTLNDDLEAGLETSLHDTLNDNLEASLNDSPFEGADTDLDEDAFDLGGEEPAPAGDSFDSFNMGGEDAAALDLGNEAPAEAELSDADFALPGFDDALFGETGQTVKAAPPTRGRGRAKETASDDVEEIQLSEEDLGKLRETLGSYPLNLRIACEELIAEQAVDPAQMSKLIRMLINGAPAKETAALAGQILGRTITIPKGFEKSTGEALEAEQSSFAYIFVHNFLPVLRNFSLIAVLLACVGYLGYKFVYTPFHAESLYKRGYERISAGEYQRANQLFSEAFSTRRKKDWFYKYAEAFRDERRYMYAEEKYDELLRWYPRDKKGVLDYASLETNYLMNYAKADSLLRHELLDYAPDDREGLLAAGDNFLAWGETDPSKYEDARFSYARLLEKYGWTPPVVERMMKYFIRTDNLKEVLPLKDWFEASNKRRLSAPSLAELGGYLLDKQLEKAKGVPNAYVASIDGVRALLLEAVREQPSLPEPHYHLARYYNNLGNVREERITLENAIKAFDMAKEESIRRLGYRIDTHLRYANVLVNNREFFPAEEQLVRGISLYEDALTRNLVSRSPQYGKLYAGLGDLEYFVKTGSMETALSYYRRSEQNGWAPPEMQYRMGAAYYQLEDWKNALEYLFRASADLPLNRRLLFALGNAAYKRNDYFAAQGYYNRLLDILENQRSRLPVLLPNDRPEFLELGERLMMARNNAGVVYEALANQTGSRSYRSRAMSLYAESARAWDAITRSPTTMVRSPGVNLGFLNVTNALRPAAGYEPEIFIRIDKDVLEPSMWEELAPVAGLGGEAR